MARARLAKHPQPEEFPAEEESQEEPEKEMASNNHAPITKAEAVRQALAAGCEKPDEGMAYVREHFGIELQRPHWSSYAAQHRAKERKASGEEPRPRPQQPIPTNFASDIKEIRHLLDRMGGAEEAKELIGQLAGLVGRYGSGGLSELIDAIS